MKFSSAILLGLVSGALVGFAYGQGVRDRAADSVSVEVGAGVLHIFVDLKKMLLGAL